MKVSLNVSTSSVYKLQAKLMDRGRFLSNKMLEAADDVVQDIMQESQEQVPVHTGTLASAAFVESDRQGITFGYGGNNDTVNPKTGQLASDYMVVVHEDMDAFHVKGKAKFLEDPINRALSSIEGKLGSRLRR